MGAADRPGGRSAERQGGEESCAYARLNQHKLSQSLQKGPIELGEGEALYHLDRARAVGRVTHRWATIVHPSTSRTRPGCTGGRSSFWLVIVADRYLAVSRAKASAKPLELKANLTGLPVAAGTTMAEMLAAVWSLFR